MLRVADAARDAMVAGDPAAACALLTPHGRERSKGYGRAYEDTPSCEAALAYVVEISRDPSAGVRELEDLARAEFEVTDIDGSTARVDADAGQGGEPIEIELRKTADGWRVHDSDVVPEGD